MDLIEKLERFIYESPAWKLLLAVFVLCLVKTGIWHMPSQVTSLHIVRDPFVNPFGAYPEAHYLVWNWLGPFLAWLVGASSINKLFALHLAFSAAFTSLFVRAAFTHLPQEASRTAVILFAVLPVSTTAYFWVGTDSLTLLLMMVALAFPGVAVVTFLCGLLLGMQHFEQGIFAAAALLFPVFASRRQGYELAYSVKFSLLLFLGAVAGKLALAVLFRHYGIEVNSGRAYYLREHFQSLVSAFFVHLPYILWSVLGTGWLVALRFADWGWRAVPFFLGLAGLCALLPVVADQTRVMAVVSFPLVSAYWLLNRDFLGKLGRREVAFIFAIWVILPFSWVWEGVPRWSVFPYDVAYVLHQAFGWFAVPEDAMLWPFK
jgi:hypothetical protein